jgi:ABC-2 type transport system ATP-binding protein
LTGFSDREASTRNTVALEVADLVHSYGDRPALCGVTFSVDEGELFGLLGPNGGGKTTLFRAVTTLLSPTGGGASVFGYSATRNPSQVRRLLGVVFQQTALDAELTVLENLRFHGALVGLGGKPLDARIEELLEAFGLTERGGDRVRTLSGGLARRTDLARGLLHKPPVLLLDEPTTGLDPTARRELWTLLGRLRREHGTTVMIATHLMEEAERCDHVGILDRGHLVAFGAPADLKAELGGEALWLESRDPSALAELIEGRLGVSPRLVGELLLVESPDVPATLASVLGAFPEMVDSATVRRPTLDDIFAIRTGARIDSEHQPLPT